MGTMSLPRHLDMEKLKEALGEISLTLRRGPILSKLFTVIASSLPRVGLMEKRSKVPPNNGPILHPLPSLSQPAAGLDITSVWKRWAASGSGMPPLMAVISN